VAGKEVVPEAAPDIHLEQVRPGSFEVDVPAGAVERFLLPACLVDLVEGILPFTERLEGEFVRASRSGATR
jgi:hypothetical protein